jgi:hypothetical protein
MWSLMQQGTVCTPWKVIADHTDTLLVANTQKKRGWTRQDSPTCAHGIMLSTVSTSVTAAAADAVEPVPVDAWVVRFRCRRGMCAEVLKGTHSGFVEARSAKRKGTGKARKEVVLVGQPGQCECGRGAGCKTSKCPCVQANAQCTDQCAYHNRANHKCVRWARTGISVVTADLRAPALPASATRQLQPSVDTDVHVTPEAAPVMTLRHAPAARGVSRADSECEGECEDAPADMYGDDEGEEEEEEEGEEESDGGEYDDSDCEGSERED